MDQHPIPRQITSFEFKLIGFLTIKQFIYLIVFVGLGLAVYGLTPIPILNILFGIITAGIGAAFAFIPINDRPMEVWVKNLIKRLTSPTQYIFRKENKPIAVLVSSGLNPNPQLVATHIDSQQKLNSYLSTQISTSPGNNKKQTINTLISNPLSLLASKPTQKTQHQQKNTQQQAQTKSSSIQSQKHPFITGSIKNHKETPLAGILIYVKKTANSEPLRILKSNAHGVFLSFNPLTPGEYFFEAKDPKGAYLFDTIKIRVKDMNNDPILIVSKELI